MRGDSAASKRGASSADDKGPSSDPRNTPLCPSLSCGAKEVATAGAKDAAPRPEAHTPQPLHKGPLAPLQQPQGCMPSILPSMPRQTIDTPEDLLISAPWPQYHLLYSSASLPPERLGRPEWRLDQFKYTTLLYGSSGIINCQVRVHTQQTHTHTHTHKDGSSLNSCACVCLCSCVCVCGGVCMHLLVRVCVCARTPACQVRAHVRHIHTHT